MSSISINSFTNDIFHYDSGGIGKNCFFSMETSEKGRDGSNAHSMVMRRKFAPVTLLQSSLTVAYTSHTDVFGNDSSFLVNDINAL